MVDRHGVIRSDRPQYNNGEKPSFINDAGPKTLAEACDGADILLGVSGPGLVTEDEVKSLAPKAVLFACSNPDPEVDPELVKRVRPDIIMGTGRSDYPNQINNVLCFPFLFRGTLDVRATCINLEMKKAATAALLQEIREDVPPIEDVIAFFESPQGIQAFGPERAQAIASHAREVKARGGKWCDCPACAAGRKILESASLSA